MKTAFYQQHAIVQLRARHFAQPMGSVLHDLCMKHCLDLHAPQIPKA